MGDDDLTTILVAALSGGTLGMIVREIVAGIVKMLDGMRARERDVKNEREETLAKARAETAAALAEVDRCRQDVANARALAAETVATVGRRLDIEMSNRRAIEAWAAEMQMLAIAAGLADRIPARPQLERVE